ncbi:MAG TPA: Zn-dependent hydrolase [Bacteroidales bacterium]|nr:Zn-dependent hydrolase [Bacteroidales bacterium]HRX95884.1 Zn-dependent hydrolase [Bacteroidales bacterium]
MFKKIIFSGLILTVAAVMISCQGNRTKIESSDVNSVTNDTMKELVDKYVSVKLTSDISHLTDNEKEMLRLLFKAADLIDDIFWMQNFGDKEQLLSSIESPYAREFAEINYGPWDELDGLKSFIGGYGEKSAGANFYPVDMTKEEFEAFEDPNKTSQYTLIRRAENGALQSIWYHEAYNDQINQAADLLKKASELAGDPEFANYLALRAEALLTDQYQASDMAWLDVKNNNVDLVIGPIENYADNLYGYKAAHESYILIKDREWSEKLSRYAAFLPQLQKELPVDPVYKQETPGSDADLNAYDVVYYAGDCNKAGKTIAINLPNDEEVQLAKGTRKLQLKNAMKAKFDHILVPIAEKLISADQQKYITFDAFFSNTMFHEVAHGMGIKNTITGEGTVRHALQAQYSAIEEGKADILGIYLVTRLHEMGEFTDTDLMDNYVTFMAGIFRSVRFGAASAHGKANMVRFNFFSERNAFTKNEDGTYSIDIENMKTASKELTQLILKIQGDGDMEAAIKLLEEKGVIPAELQTDLDKLNEAGIPVDIEFDQGPQMLGL